LIDFEEAEEAEEAEEECPSDSRLSGEMPKTKLTAQSLLALSALEGQRTECRKDLPGFSVRVRRAETFSVLYRRGRRRRYSGRYPVLGLSQARTLARKALAEAVMGGDPDARKIEERRAETFSDLCREYLERYAKTRKRSWREDERRIQKSLLPNLGHRPVGEIRRVEVRSVLESIANRGAGIEANRTLALVRRIFNWGISVDLVERNPCALIPRPARERMRSHVLSAPDIRALFSALEKERPWTSAALRLMLLTAQRGGEVLGMRWADVDFSEGCWTIPEERSKNGLSHRVPLSPPAVALLESQRLLCGESPWVFPCASGRGPLAGIQKAIQRVRRRAGIDLRGHDLRRTAASNMASMGIPRLVIARILNHVETGVTAVYDRHSYDREKREALEVWGRRLAEIVGVSGSESRQ
jgi:integrase